MYWYCTSSVPVPIDQAHCAGFPDCRIRRFRWDRKIRIVNFNLSPDPTNQESSRSAYTELPSKQAYIISKEKGQKGYRQIG
jgi:hypothetical protein